MDIQGGLMKQPPNERDKWRLLLERVYAHLEDSGVDVAAVDKLREKGKKLLEGHNG